MEKVATLLKEARLSIDEPMALPQMERLRRSTEGPQGYLLRKLDEAIGLLHFELGTPIRLTDGIRPKYLIGLVGTVTRDLRPREQRVQVRLETPELAGRYETPARHGTLCVPAELVEPAR